MCQKRAWYIVCRSTYTCAYVSIRLCRICRYFHFLTKHTSKSHCNCCLILHCITSIAGRDSFCHLPSWIPHTNVKSPISVQQVIFRWISIYDIWWTTETWIIYRLTNARLEKRWKDWYCVTMVFVSYHNNIYVNCLN